MNLTSDKHCMLIHWSAKWLLCWCTDNLTRTKKLYVTGVLTYGSNFQAEGTFYTEVLIEFATEINLNTYITWMLIFMTHCHWVTYFQGAYILDILKMPRQLSIFFTQEQSTLFYLDNWYQTISPHQTFCRFADVWKPCMTRQALLQVILLLESFFSM